MTASDWADALTLRTGDGPVYLAGCCGEPTALYDAIEDDPSIAKTVTFTGVWIPGINRRDPTAGGQGARAVSSFMTPALQPSVERRAVEILPMHYSETFEWLKARADLSAAVFQVSPPDAGVVSLGIASDFTPALLDTKVPLIGQINPQMPAPASSTRIPVDRFAALIPAESDLLTYESGPVSETYRVIANRVASLLQRGDTIQLGLGTLQAAVLNAIADGLDLGLHAGMISTPLLDCLDNDVFSLGVTTGVALGKPTFYRQVASDARITFRPVGHTHNSAILTSIPSFVSINSMIEVDLFGQANGEFFGSKQVSGHGGLLDFIRGARSSKGGRSIIALPSTAAKGRQTRVVPSLPRNRPITVPRSDVDWVVTEHGAVCLRDLSVQRRAEAMISIAAPDFRDELANAWDAICREAMT